MPDPDPRHHLLRQHIAQAFREANDLELVWSGHHAKVLANFLKSCCWPIERLVECVNARFASEEINPCEDALKWIPKLPNYARGPLDRYQRPIYKPKSVTEDWRAGFESAEEAFQRLAATRRTQ